MKKNDKTSLLIIMPTKKIYYNEALDFAPNCIEELKEELAKLIQKHNLCPVLETKQPIKSNIKAHIPTSIYRIQLSKKINFNYLKDNIDYFKELGITELYLSPIFQANSEHGYNITDFSRINKNLGSYDELKELSLKAKQNGISLILDFVPNHMGIINNKWWLDVLENGIYSKYANYFDIDFTPLKKELKNKVLLPVLGNYYGKELKDFHINLHFNKFNAKFFIQYYNNFYPLSPQTYNLILEHRKKTLLSKERKEIIDEFNSIIRQFKSLKSLNNQGLIEERDTEKNIACNRLKKLIQKSKIIEDFILENVLLLSSKTPVLHAILEKQNFRLAFWQVASDEINYRRFFDINNLAGINIEEPSVFENVHKLLFQLIQEDIISGVRLDHTDGIASPDSYFFKLQYEIAKLKNSKTLQMAKNLLSSTNLPFYIICEKILSSFEKLPKNWAVHGTTGYEFLNSLQGVFVNQENIYELKRIYEKFAGKKEIETLVNICKKDIMKNSLAGELNVLINILSQIAENNIETRDFTINNLRNALIEVISNFPVYRTYITDTHVLEKYKEYTTWALNQAKKEYSSKEVSVLEFIKNVLFLKYEQENTFELSKKFIFKFQQYTSPLMAKGVEDTHFYRYNLLLCLNEVGASHTKEFVSVSEFHKENIMRLKTTPHSIITTSTHDTKRSEDARNKIVVLSQIPKKWEQFLESWCKYNDYFKEFNIADDDFYHFIQSLIAIFPLKQLTQDDINLLQNRLKRYMQKAVKEAKLNTSWLNQNLTYERNLDKFIEKFIGHYKKTPYWKILVEIIYECNLRGMVNSLNSVGLKLTSPGIPDIYNGNENFTYQLVDPDNRIDLDLSFTDEKYLLTKLLLNFRNLHKDLLIKGEYIPIEFNNDFICYKRTFDNQNLVCVFNRNSSNIWSLKDIKQQNFKMNIELLKEIIPKRVFSITQNKEITQLEYSCKFPLEVLYWQSS